MADESGLVLLSWAWMSVHTPRFGVISGTCASIETRKSRVCCARSGRASRRPGIMTRGGVSSRASRSGRRRTCRRRRSPARASRSGPSSRSSSRSCGRSWGRGCGRSTWRCRRRPVIQPVITPGVAPASPPPAVFKPAAAVTQTVPEPVQPSIVAPPSPPPSQPAMIAPPAASAAGREADRSRAATPMGARFAGSRGRAGRYAAR